MFILGSIFVLEHIFSLQCSFPKSAAELVTLIFQQFDSIGIYKCSPSFKNMNKNNVKTKFRLPLLCFVG